MNQAATFSTIRTEIAGVSVLDLASTFETPTYVYDGSKILERIDELRQFDVIRYAQRPAQTWPYWTWSAGTAS